MDRTTVLHKLEMSEQYRLEVSRTRSRGFVYMLLIPVFNVVILSGLIAHKFRSSASR